MNANNEISYEKSLELFKKNQISLPQKIRWKLNYISSLVEGKQIKQIENLPQLYQLEIFDLKGVNDKGLQIIFTSIVQTLFSQQIPIDKQCLIRKKGFFKSWTDGFIKYDDSYIYFNCSNKTSRYRFKNVDINLNSKSKRAFDFFYKGQQLMTIKFQKPESMHTMYKTIKGFIYNQKNLYDQKIIKKISNSSQRKQNQQSKLSQNRDVFKKQKIEKQQQSKSVRDKNEKKMTYYDQKYDNTIQKKHRQQQKSNQIVMQFQKYTLSQQQNLLIFRNSKKNSEQKQLKLNIAPDGYQIKSSSKKMYISLHPKQVKLNLEVIIKLCDKMKLNEIISCLCCYKNWNSRIIKEEICYQMKFEQKAIIYRVYQRTNSILSKSRQTYTILEFKKISPNTAIFVQESLQNQDKQQQYTRAYLRSIFFIETYENSLKISLQSELNPKGYCSNSQGQQLLYSIYKDIAHFQNYLSEYSIKNSKNSEETLFSAIDTEDQKQNMLNNQYESMKNYQSMDELQGEKSSDEEQKKNTRTSLQIYRRSSTRYPFLLLRPDSPSKIPTIQYLELIRKKQFEKYYLKHSFQFKVIQNGDSYSPWYCLQQLLKKGGQYEITEKKELRFINQKLIQSQKDILRFLIRQIGANLISGKSVLNVSLPVDIFQPRTLLQRSASSLGKCPDYLLKICQSQPLLQIMNVAEFIATVPTLQLVMQKPFNPILGQTFQCYLKGIPLYYEQISHHPPISSYYMECQQFKLYGNLIAFADVGLNSGVGGNLGVMHIIFKNGYHYQCHFPPSQISGLIYGDRKFRSYGRGYIIQRKEGLLAQFSIQKTKKSIYQSKQKMLPGSIIGGIFKVNNKFFQFLNSYNNNLKKFPGISKDHIIEKLVHISGIWFDKIYMNQKLINQKIRSYPIQYYRCSLPSDANFRLDVLYHKQNNLPQSQKQKEILENIQRDDRKLRQKYLKFNKR